jgi:hypothetical protein
MTGIIPLWKDRSARTNLAPKMRRNLARGGGFSMPLDKRRKSLSDKCPDIVYTESAITAFTVNSEAPKVRRNLARGGGAQPLEHGQTRARAATRRGNTRFTSPRCGSSKSRRSGPGASPSLRPWQSYGRTLVLNNRQRCHGTSSCQRCGDTFHLSRNAAK